jgi:6-phosphogluconolactonase/glucosamine-6-phosphate isomerase/deaminase
MSKFRFEPADFVPFREREVLDKIRNIKREDIENHSNPDVRIKVVRNSQIPFIQFTDMLCRIKDASESGEEIAIITGNPNPGYANLAHMINKLQVNCERLWIINMDEWADEDGNTAPEDYPQSFMRAMKKYFYSELDENLRLPENQIVGPTTENVSWLTKWIIDKFGGADACYSGSGWAGHIAFVDPDVPEFDAPLDEWKKMGARIVTLHPYTVLQNSLHASFGSCGDTAFVPPKAATIGPADVIAAKYRMDRSAITIGGSNVSWQKFITRLVAHGPVTPKVPASILQTLPTDFYIAESIAADIEPEWYKGY